MGDTPAGQPADDRWDVVAHHDWGTDESLVVTLLRALSDDPANEPPLYESVDAEALQRLIDSAHVGKGRVGVRFSWAGRDVSVDSEGRVAVRPHQGEE